MENLFYCFSLNPYIVKCIELALFEKQTNKQTNKQKTCKLVASEKKKEQKSKQSMVNSEKSVSKMYSPVTLTHLIVSLPNFF